MAINWAQALGGFGAGLQGNLPQFQAVQQQERQLSMQEQQQRQAFENERKKTMFIDADAALKLLDGGNLDGVINLGLQRLEHLKGTNADPSDTQRLTQLAIAAKNGAPEARQLLRNELQGAVELGTAYGILKAPEGPQIVPGSSIVNGQIVTIGANGQPAAMQIPGFKQEAAQIDYNKPFLPDGSPNTAYQNYQIRQAEAGKTAINLGDSGSAALNTKIDDQFAAAIDTASTSSSAAPQLQMLEQLAPLTSEGRIPEAISRVFPTFNDANTAYTGLVNQVLPSLRVPGSGAQSDRDIDVLQKSIGQLSASAETKVLLVKSLQDKNRINQELADVATEYASGTIGRTEALRKRREINSRTIISPELQKALGGVAGAAGRTVFDEADAIIRGEE